MTPKQKEEQEKLKRTLKYNADRFNESANNFAKAIRDSSKLLKQLYEK